MLALGCVCVCVGGGGGGALPYVGHIGMCHPKGCGFYAVLISKGTRGVYERIYHFSSK